MNYTLMGVVLGKRREHAPKVQEILTRNGCIIKIRLGLHEAGDVCSESGFIILQLCGAKEEIERFKAELTSVPGVKAEYMTIEA